MTSLLSLKRLYPHFLSPEFVFKSVTIPTKKSSLKRIIVLKKVSSTITNLGRKSIIDITNAQGRGSEFYVQEILDKDIPSKTYTCTKNHIGYIGIQYVLNGKMEYVKGQNIKVSDFDFDLENNNSKGIHFFNSLDDAFYDYNVPRVIIPQKEKDMKDAKNKSEIQVNSFTKPFIVKTHTPEGSILSRSVYPFGKQEYWWYNSQHKLSEYFTKLYDYDIAYGSEITTGVAKQWHQNGKLRVECNFAENGYNISENINNMITRYYDDILHGNFIEFYDNNCIKLKGQFDNNKRVGKWELYTDDGVLHSTVLFDKGLKVKHEIHSKKKNIC
jgi:antitoxin component YwqK of YwqJK toxin-antitoxin module